MAGKKRQKEKEPDEMVARTGSDDVNVIVGVNHITDQIENQEDLSETQLYQKDEKKYKQPIADDVKGRHWLFVVYEDSAPDDWELQLESTGIPFVRSPYHDSDVNPDGSPKKAHWHLIVSYNNSTTYNNIKGLRKITHGPFPIKCMSVSGSYAYLTHKNNPEKAQYSTALIVRFNGWEKVLEASEVTKIKDELTIMVMTEDITEYGELMIAVQAMDGDYKQVASGNTVYFRAVIESYYRNPKRMLCRYLKQIDEKEDPDTGQLIRQRIGYYNTDNYERLNNGYED